ELDAQQRSAPVEEDIGGDARWIGKSQDTALSTARIHGRETVERVRRFLGQDIAKIRSEDSLRLSAEEGSGVGADMDDLEADGIDGAKDPMRLDLSGKVVRFFAVLDPVLNRIL